MDDLSKNNELLVAANQKIKEKNFWQERLSGDLVKIGFPADLTGPLAGETGSKNEILSFSIPHETAAGALKISGGSDLRLFVVSASALTLLLQRYSGQNNIILAAPVNRGQAPADMNELINTMLIVRSALNEHMTFKELILGMGKSLYDAAEHQNYPLHLLPQLLDLSFPEESGDGSFPLLDTAVMLENIHDAGHLECVPLETLFSFNKSGNRLTGQVRYNAARFSEHRISRIAGHLVKVLEQTMAAVDTPLGHIDILSREQRHRLLVQFNQPSDDDLEEIKKSTILAEFEEQARRVPDFLALVEIREDAPARPYTYEGLLSEVTKLAGVLRNRGVSPGSVVAVMCKRSAQMVAAMLAVFKAGCAFLPLSMVYPQAMRRFFLEDSGAAALLTDRDLEPGEVPENIPVLRVDQIEEMPDLAELHEPTPFDPAYVIYATGTGEKPAAAMMNHQAIYSFIYALYRRFDAGFGVGDKCLNLTDTSLDLGISELFLPLVFGCTLVIAPDETLFDPATLAGVLLDQSVTFAFIPAGVLEETALHLKPEKSALQLDKLLLGGANTGTGVLETYRGLRQNMQICFGYGPVEAAVCSIMYQHPMPKVSLFGDAFQSAETAESSETVEPAEPGKTGIPAGRPLGGARVMVLDKALRLCPAGVTGELWISGSRLALGYVNRPGLTAATFLPNHYTEGERMVAAGETGYWDEEGNIHLTGPARNLININGYRIHPAEIREHLLSHEAVADALVALRGRQDGEGLLCAYLVPSGENDLPKTHEWVAYLSQHLPAYMIPLHFTGLEQIPLTPGGQVDFSALPDPSLESKTKTQFVAPENELQQAIAETWKSVLNKDSIGVDDNFFEIGGNSLGILKLKDQLRKQLGHEVPDIKFLEYPTIRTFHAYLENEVLGTGSGGISGHDEQEDESDQDDAAGRLRMRSRLLDDEED